MQEISNTFIEQLLQSSAIELFAVVFAILYLLLATRENSWCWPAALVSTLLFLYIFWDVRLYMESALQIYYIGMAIYGWRSWTDTHKPALTISTWNFKKHLIALALILFATLITGWLLKDNTNARLPVIDSFTTWGSIVTTYMVARKILENWLYWLVIDSVSIYLYLDRGLYFTALLFVVYIIIIFFGWFTWLKSLQQSTD